MSSPYGRLVLIANPRAGRGAMAAALPKIQAALRAERLDHRVALTTGPGHAARLAAEALRSGERFVVAAGGDGTVHEVVNGMVRQDRVVADAVLGVVPYGSGCDFVRTLDIPGDPVRACHRLAGDTVRAIDIGKVAYHVDGGTAVRYFANIAEAGLGAAVAGTAARLPAALGPARYFVAVWMVLPGLRRTTVRAEVDGTVTGSRPLNIVVANGRFFGGGMQISPKSRADDGLLDLLVLIGPKSDAFAVVPRVYRGTHLPHRNIMELQGRRIVIDTETPLPVEADGELLGTTPATFDVLPRLVTVKV